MLDTGTFEPSIINIQWASCSLPVAFLLPLYSSMTAPLSFSKSSFETRIYTRRTILIIKTRIIKKSYPNRAFCVVDTILLNWTRLKPKWPETTAPACRLERGARKRCRRRRWRRSDKRRIRLRYSRGTWWCRDWCISWWHWKRGAQQCEQLRVHPLLRELICRDRIHKHRFSIEFNDSEFRI